MAAVVVLTTRVQAAVVPVATGGLGHYDAGLCLEAPTPADLVDDVADLFVILLQRVIVCVKLREQPLLPVVLGRAAAPVLAGVLRRVAAAVFVDDDRARVKLGLEVADLLHLGLVLAQLAELLLVGMVRVARKNLREGALCGRAGAHHEGRLPLHRSCRLLHVRLRA